MVATLENHENSCFQRITPDSSEMSYKTENESRAGDDSVESVGEDSSASPCATTCNGSHVNKTSLMSNMKISEPNDVLPNFISPHSLDSLDNNYGLRSLPFDTNDLCSYPASLYALASTALRFDNDHIYHPNELEMYASLLSKQSKLVNIVNALPNPATNEANRNARKSLSDDIAKNFLHYHHSNSTNNSNNECPLDFSFRQRKPTSSSEESSDSHLTSTSPNEPHSKTSVPGTINNSILTFADTSANVSTANNSGLYTSPAFHSYGVNLSQMSTLKNGKITRPFKAYPRDPLSLPIGIYSLQFSSLCQDGMYNFFSGTDDFCRQYRKRIQQAQERLVQRLSNSQLQQQSNSSEEKKSCGTMERNDSPKNTKNSETSNNTSTPKIFYNSSKPEISPSGTTILPPPKKRHRSLPEDVTRDDAYWERRRKNNEAAKRSRDARRAKEDEIAIKAALLEQENLKLRVEVAQLKQETNKLRCMLYNS